MSPFLFSSRAGHVGHRACSPRDRAFLVNSRLSSQESLPTVEPRLRKRLEPRPFLRQVRLGTDFSLPSLNSRKTHALRQADYLSSTSAPAASSLPLISSASAWSTPSL